MTQQFNYVRKRGRILALIVAAIVALVCSPLAASNAHAAGEKISIVGNTTFTTNAINPSAEVVWSKTGTDYLYVDELIAANTWEQKGSFLGYQVTGKEDIFSVDYEAAGIHTYRLRTGKSAKDTTAVSQNFTVTINRTKTTFNVGSLSNTAKLHNANYRWITNEVYYELEKTVSLTYAGVTSVKELILQRKDGSKWVKIGSINIYPYYLTPTDSGKLKIRPATSGTKQYRFYIKQDDYVTGGYSKVFKIKAAKAAPKLAVKYNKSSQKYKKGGVKINIGINDKGAFEGTAYVYDGNKRIAKLTVLRGYIGNNGYYGKGNTYALPASLKKGTHKIKVKFVPSKDYAPFYKSQTSAVKKIVVK